jgi:asparagine synthase (glutamine-hydrolysing)
VPLNEWFRGPLRSTAYDLLTDSDFRQSGIFCPQTVLSLLDAHMAAEDNFGTDILALVNFELWRRNLHQARIGN